MNSRSWALFAVTAALLSVALAGCGGDGDTRDNPFATFFDRQSASESDTDPRGEAVTDSAANNTEARPAAANGVMSQPTVPATRPRTEPVAALKQVSRQLAASNYKVVYEIHGSDRDTGALDGTLTLATKQPKQLFGISGKLGNDSGTFLVINDGANAFLCIEGRGDKACLKTHSVADAPIPLPSVLNIDDVLENIANQPGVQVREVAGQQIAGYDGRCFEVEANVGHGTICVDEQDGLVLLVDGDFQGSAFSMRLTEYDPEPPDSLFLPPYTVTELP